MAGTSHINPNNTIHLQITPVSNLKYAIAALKDTEFNQENVARVDITEMGFQLTVVNRLTRVVGHLCLDAAQFVNFRCTQPVVNKIISLREIPLLVLGCSSPDIVTISRRGDENCLTFVFGDSEEEYPIEFINTAFDIAKFPDIEYLCEALWTTEKLKQMIEHLERTGTSQQVSVDISKSVVSVFIETKHPWIERSYDDNQVVSWGMQPGKHHHAWFEMDHLKMLMKALLLTQRCFISFLTQPAGHVMIRFALGEHGNFVSIHRADIIANSDDFIRFGVEGRFNDPV